MVYILFFSPSLVQKTGMIRAFSSGPTQFRCGWFVNSAICKTPLLKAVATNQSITDRMAFFRKDRSSQWNPSSTICGYCTLYENLLRLNRNRKLASSPDWAKHNHWRRSVSIELNLWTWSTRIMRFWRSHKNEYTNIYNIICIVTITIHRCIWYIICRYIYSLALDAFIHRSKRRFQSHKTESGRQLQNVFEGHIHLAWTWFPDECDLICSLHLK